MRIIVTAGPTREYLDPVRFITNASSGKMGYAVAACAADAGHNVSLLSGPVCLPAPRRVSVDHFTSVADLKRLLLERFDQCDVLVMSAAVGDFTVENAAATKISRKAGLLTIRLIPTEDVLSAVTATKRPSQIVVAFAVESGSPEEAAAKARDEMQSKRADYVVVNTPSAMSANVSEAAILSRQGVVLPWGSRSKDELAKAIVGLLAK